LEFDSNGFLVLDKIWNEVFIELALWQDSDLFWCVSHIKNGRWNFYFTNPKSCVSVEELAFYFGYFMVVGGFNVFFHALDWMIVFWLCSWSVLCFKW
jgi:hypothetical protein